MNSASDRFQMCDRIDKVRIEFHSHMRTTYLLHYKTAKCVLAAPADKLKDYSNDVELNHSNFSIWSICRNKIILKQLFVIRFFVRK